jgi:lipopolysaccharide biosynthesis regulator YciM
MLKWTEVLIPCLLVFAVIARPSRAADAPVVVHTKATGDYPNTNYTAVISPDGSRAAFITDSISVCDTTTGKELCVLGGKDQHVGHTEFSPDGSRLAWVGPANPLAGMTLWVYDVPSRKLVYSHHDDGSLEFLFAGSGKALIQLTLPGQLGNMSGQISLLDLDSGKATWSLDGKRVDFIWSNVSSDGTIISANESGITQWNLRDGTTKQQIRLPGNNRPALLNLSDPAKTVRAIFSDGTVAIWDLASGKQLSRVEPQDLIRGQPLCVSPDGKSLLVAVGDVIRFFDLQTGKETAQFRAASPVYACTPVARNGKFVAGANSFRYGDADIVTLVAGAAKAPAPARDPQPVPPAPAQAPSPPAKLGVLNPGLLQSASWWCAAANAEAQQLTDPQVRGQEFSRIALAFAKIGDVQQAMDCLHREGAAGGIAGAHSRSVFDQQAASILVKLLARSGRQAEAMKIIDGWRENPSAEQWIVGEFAIGLALAGDISSAIQNAASLKPEMKSRIYLEMINALADEGKPDTAQEALNHFGQPSNSPDMQRIIAVGFARTGKAKEAIAIAESIAKSAPKFDLQMRSLYGDLAAAAAAGGHNEAANAIVEKTPEKEREAAREQVGVGQVHRGDLAAAESTLHSVASARSGYQLRRELALAYARKGDYPKAEAVDGREIGLEMFFIQFHEMVDRSQFDAAMARLGKVHEDNPRNMKSDLRLSLAAVMALHNQPEKAIALYQNTQDDQNFETAKMVVDSVYLRSGNASRYEADRNPLVAKLSAATGAPSRLQAAQELFAFDLLTGNFKTAFAEMPKAEIEEKGLVLGFMEVLNKRIEFGDFAYARDFVAALPSDEQRAFSIFGSQVAAAHLNAGKALELASWIKTFPAARQRCEIYLAAADALISPTTKQ